MYFAGTGFSHKGIVKEQNQDSYLLKIADTDMGNVALASVADGMGGLSSGELASATVIRSLSDWFDTKLPMSLEAMEASVGGFESFVEGQWEGLVQELNLQIMRYGKQHGESLGTTLTAMLAIGARYSIMHVGDTRAYEITDTQVVQLTKDQTFVEREIEAGRLTPQEAAKHPQRNVLLQCLGASKEVKPEIIHGNLRDGAIYLICSDGFRHVLTNDELANNLGPTALRNVMSLTVDGHYPDKNVLMGSAERTIPLKRYLQQMVNVVMDRKERDNITVLAIEASRTPATGGTPMASREVVR